MIIGLGTDIVDIPRIQKSLDKYGQAFCDRVFTRLEQDYCNQSKALRTHRFAKRFAAKEAVLKALGTGRSAGIGWKDVSVSNLESGQPTLKFSGIAKQILEKKSAGKPVKTHLSLSDTQTLATATVILEIRNETLKGK